MMQFQDYDNRDKYPHFVIEGTLPSLNEYLAAIGKSPYKGGRMKSDCMERVGWSIRSQLRGYKTTCLLTVHFVYYEPSARRDKDNVHAMSSKVILDSLQACNVIPNDGWNNIYNSTHDYFIDKVHPRIEVYLEEMTEDNKFIKR